MIVLALIMGFLIAASVCDACVSWTPDGTAVCAEDGSQKALRMIKDGNGGAIMVWQDSRGGPDDIYAQKIDYDGNTLWSDGGVPVCTASGIQQDCRLTTDGAGGAIITWEDTRSDSVDVYAQKIGAAGNPVWTHDGVEVRASPITQDNLAITSDGQGGAIIAWEHYFLFFQHDIYAQRVTSGGGLAWNPEGVALGKLNTTEKNVALVEDGQGGAYACWEDERRGFSKWSIYVQGLSGAGAVLWEENGTAVYEQEKPQNNHVIVNDGFGNLVVAWEDDRMSNWLIDDTNIYAQKFNPAGEKQWEESGAPVCEFAVFSEVDPAMAADGLGNVYLTFANELEVLGIGIQWDVWMQKLNEYGERQFSHAGWELSTAPGNQELPCVISDGAGGAIFSWRDGRAKANPQDTNYDLYAQRIDADGNRLILHPDDTGEPGYRDYNGYPICTEGSEQCMPKAVLAGRPGTAYICWRDKRADDGDIYCQRFYHPTITGVRPPEGYRGQSPGISIEGDLTNFSPATEVTLESAGSGNEIAAFSVSPSGPESLLAEFEIPLDADTGAYKLKVETGIEKAEMQGAFDVAAGGPVLSSIQPGEALLGKTLDVTVNGLYTHFTEGATTVDFGNGVSVNSLEIKSKKKCVAIITVAPDAKMGGRDVTVTSDIWGGWRERVSLDGGFLVTREPPEIKSMTPKKAFTGDVINANIGGDYFRDVTGVALGRGGSWKIPGRNLKVPGRKELTCSFDLAEAGDGIYSLRLETRFGETAVLDHALAVGTPPPAIEAVEPAGGFSGEVLDVVVRGIDFSEWAQVTFEGPSGAKEGEQVTLETLGEEGTPQAIYCSVGLEEAPTGKYSVTVENPDGQSDTLAGALEVFPPKEAGGRSRWYLAEGTTDWGFDTYISIANPNDEQVTVDITYMTPEGEVPGGRIPLPERSQTTIYPRETLGAKDFSTRVACLEPMAIAVDRTMMWKGPGAASPDGHCSVGVSAPAKTWYFAEGSSDHGFESWVLVQNPNGAPASCKFVYMPENSDPVTLDKEIPAGSRASFSMAVDIGAQDASVYVESDIPVVAERAMYRNNRREGHDSIGVPLPSRDFFLAEGSSNWGFTTYVLVQNPNDSETGVTLSYMTDEGLVPQAVETMAPFSRKTFRVNDQLPGKDFSTHVHGSAPVVAERAMYWGEGTPAGEACHATVGYSEAHTLFHLPDGQAGNGYETWTLVQNPNSQPVQVEITYLTPRGTGNRTLTHTLDPYTRATFSMSDLIGEGRASVVVESKTEGMKVLAERAMYWNQRGAGTVTIGGPGQ
jgi:hypothetical protein